MAELNKIELRNYLLYKFETEKGNIISPIKLQKSLYFLFAFWGGLVRSGKTRKTEDSELMANRDEYLFDPRFEAWAYGPVDREIYAGFKSHQTFDKDEALNFYNNLNPTIRDYFDSLIPKIFNTGDFSLVDLSHKDNCWKIHYHPDDPHSNETIPPEDIIEEYANK